MNKIALPTILPVERPEWKKCFIAALMIATTACIGYGLERTETAALFGLYGLLFAGYVYLLLRPQPSDGQVYFFVLTGIAMRVVLLFSFPNLSDDIYRFVWDGRLIVNGFNPFNQLPSDYIREGVLPPGLTPELFAKLNSPDYFTVYPPVAQAIFWFACYLSPNSVAGSAVVMKIILLAAETGTLILLLRLLRHFELPVSRVLIYALNPLIVLEISGNLHFEGLMVFFLMLAFYWLNQARDLRAVLAMAFSIASKLLPLLFFPLLIRRLGWKRAFVFFSLTGLLVLLSFAPLLNTVFLNNFGASLNLYFRQFEFNAGFYYLLREIGEHYSGQNLIRFIGPGLAVLTALIVLFKALFERNVSWQTLPHAALFAISTYLLLATTVHPWYTALPLVWCLFTRWRYPVVWTALIFLTYAGYGPDKFQESYGIVELEYAGVLACLIWESRFKSSLSTPK
ncbi:MAG: hypothetical protein HUU01_08875 [Saprospiraceae bacterium]|nr:hypothetical protein [Saprospiraceae bacterium]